MSIAGSQCTKRARGSTIEDFVHRSDGGARELNLQFEAAPACEGIEIGGIAAAPGEEGISLTGQ